MNFSHLFRNCALLAITIFTQSLFAAPPTIEALLPASLQQATTTEVFVSGSRSKWPVQVWCNSSDIQITPLEKEHHVQIQLPESVTPGVYLMRIFDAEGASSVHSFLVESLPHIAENEPNDALGQETKVTLPAIATGQLAASADVDQFSFNLNVGDTFLAAVRAKSLLNSPMDTVMQICDERGFVVEQNDDERGVDPMILFQPEKQGQYTVRLFAFPETPNSTIGFASGDKFVYSLTMTTDGFLDRAFPLATQRGASTEVRLAGWSIDEPLGSQIITPGPDQSQVVLFHPALCGFLTLPVVDHPCQDLDPFASEHVLPIPSTVATHISTANETDDFQFQATNGQPIQFKVASRSLGYPLDPLIKIVDPDKKVLATADDVNNENRDAELSFTAPADGVYHLQVRDVYGHGGPRYAYRLSATHPQPDYRLKLAVDKFVAAAGTELEIPITIERLDGFNEPIEITLNPLPPGIESAAVISPIEGETAKEVKLKLKGAVATNAPIQIKGTSQGELALNRTAAYAVPATDLDLAEVWVTLTAPATDE